MAPGGGRRVPAGAGCVSPGCPQPATGSGRHTLGTRGSSSQKVGLASGHLRLLAAIAAPRANAEVAESLSLWLDALFGNTRDCVLGLNPEV